MMITPQDRVLKVRRPARRFVFVTAALLAGCANEPEAPTTGASAAAVTASAAAVTAGASAAATAGPAQRTTSAVTLITGDVVHLTQGGGAPISVTTLPAAGREQVTFGVSIVQRAAGEDAIVVPSDAVALLASGLLDDQLFNVSELVREGFDDASSQTLPIIVTYQGQGLRSLAAAPAAASYHLGSINGDALVPAKSDANQVWGWLTGGGASGLATSRALAPGVAKVWLDRRAELLLEQSAPQIGAPTVWASGLTGKGVTVAILDSGLRFDHPDLVGKTLEAVDFTGTRPDASDDAGHGTHVAGIITGTGAASGGRYRGIAPDASLVIGKVCTASGSCPTSAIIAGMEWAAARARIVSMSLGSTAASDGTDPLAVAADNLSAQYGTLFIAAAGNAGAEFRVGSPAAATSALAVASVQKDDTLSSFSSRGPRIGDYAVKPEIAAPGGLIVAARAKGTPNGDLDPIDDNYTRLSGTSMATPHVSGGAALLLQQHPDWTGPQLKAALMSSAKPLGGLRVADEGAGRIDLVRATQQTVRATGSISFGVMAFPHDGKVLTQTITYQNDGDAAVTLAIAVSAVDDKLAPAPVGLFEVPPQVVVPAHGSADVAVSAIGASKWIGLFSGLITASDGVNRLETAVTILEQEPQFNLTINFVDETGAPAPGFGIMVNDDDGKTYNLFASSQTLQLPAGEYDVLSTGFGVKGDTIFGAQPSIILDRDKTVSIGANARPVVLNVDNAKAALSANSITLHAGSRNGLGASILALATKQLLVTPTPPVVNHPFSFNYRAWLTPATPPTTTDAADNFIYNLVFSNAGRIPSKPSFRVRTRDLARVLEDISNPGDAWGWHSNAGSSPDNTAIYTTAWKESMPSQRVEYYSTASTWEQTVMLFPNQPPRPFLGETSYRVDTFAPGHRYRHEWFSAPAGPSFGVNSSSFGAYRLENQIRFALGPFGWGEAGHIVRSWPGTTTLSRDGQIIGSAANSGFGTFDVPADNAIYTVATKGARNIRWSAINTAIDATWTFRSAPAKDALRHDLPVYLVRASGLFDGNDSAVAGAPFLLSVEVERQPGAPKFAVTDLSLEVSFDKGATWHKAPLLCGDDRGLALVVHPSTPGTVSLRAHARDSHGNSVTQTVTDAYRTRAAK
jgi:subtilisin family serine protease